jgi:hypothetical protein
MMSTIKTLYLAIVVFVLFGNHVHAQSIRKQKYDSLLVGDRITPAVSSVMMPRSYTEVILNNSLLTTNSYYKEDRERLAIGERYTYLINTLQVTHGVSSSGRLNVGLDISYRTGRADADPDSSPLAVFGSSSEGLIQYERAFTSVGIRARYVPTRNKNFVIQHVFSIPFSTSGEANEFLGDNRYTFNTQFLYTQLLGRKIFLFGQTDILYRFEDGQDEGDFTNPVYVFMTYLVNSHLFPFVQVGMTNTWNNEFEHLRQSFTYGIGLQYQFTTLFNINAFYNDVFAGKTTYRFNGYNLGVRVVF